MKKKTLILAVALLVMAAASGNAFAGAGWHDKSGKGPDKGRAVMRELGLTPEQEKRLEEGRAAHRQDMKALLKEMEEKKSELKKALAKSDVSRRDVESIAADLKRLQGKLVDKRVDGIFRVKSVFTPEQFNKFQEMKEKKMMRKGSRRDRKERRS